MALHRSFTAFWNAVNQLIPDALVRPFNVIVLDELADRTAQVAFTEWHHSVQALGLVLSSARRFDVELRLPRTKADRGFDG